MELDLFVLFRLVVVVVGCFVGFLGGFGIRGFRWVDGLGQIDGLRGFGSLMG